MQIENTALKYEERVTLELRGLYSQYGYTCYKMGKFEEYDLYNRNKEFLVSDSVITFTDTNGKLMALKPDVTLSIVKNSKAEPGCVQRLYYNENVYRISGRTHSYREIMQTGLECIGSVDLYHCCEVLGLAAQSLQAIAQESVLNVSHLGVISKALEGIELGEDFQQLLKCVEEKNTCGVKALCEQYGIATEKTALLCALPNAYGPAETVLPALRKLGADAASLDELETVLQVCGAQPGVAILLDFSVLNQMKYYNGLVFRGYVKGIPTRVLSGGQYDRLLNKMGRQERAIGFAVYLDMLERLDKTPDVDVDVLLLYGADDSPTAVLQRVQALTAAGKRVTAQRRIPGKLTYSNVEYLGKGEA